MMKKSAPAEVEMQIVPMLDMAFQLLTFFILTYHPAPVEGQFSMNLLPAAPVLKTDAPPPDPNAQPNPDIPASLRTLTTVLHANPDGSLGRVSIGDVDLPAGDPMAALRSRLIEIKSDPNNPFDQTLIKADSVLKYEELIKVIDIFQAPKIEITKISFSEIDANAPGAAGL